MTISVDYISGAELGDLAVEWFDDDGTTVLDYSTGWTFEVKVGTPGAAALFTKSSGIVGAATLPNIVVAWATTGELNSLPVDAGYTLQLKATRTADGKARIRHGHINMLPAVT